ncbi:TetR/AcrR family transcriptional regulator [Streptomyces sp. RFCAC02]|uniref:TetR/AcrR family transcriptional regulator n=1 Tax=Streptomyces sp. RFCAC02 TaxID=2499143 RepID=UPI00101F85C0|nr:TetR/AcrR family transcriptional regulator [Streptomyces sp. RFCAC02]
MPRYVDHEERRGRLVDAVWTLAVRGGLEEVTLRRVAAEAGVSMGQVQHYYPSMQSLIGDALDRAVLAVNADIERAVREAGDAGPEAVLRACLRALVSPSDGTLRLLRFSLAAAGRAVSDPATCQVLAPGGDELLTFTAGLITAARRDRGRPPLQDERTEADICWSLATSLGVDVALGYRTHRSAGSTLDHHIDRLLGAG